MANPATLLLNWPGPGDPGNVRFTIDSLVYAANILDQRTANLNTSGIGRALYPTRVVTAAGAITVAATDYAVVVNKTVAAASAVALPAGVIGQAFVIKDGKGDAAANNITITPAAGTIDSAATLVISANYGVARLLYNGTEWNVV